MKESLPTIFFWLSCCYGIFLLQISENSKFCLWNLLFLIDFSLSFYDWNTTWGAVSGVIFHLKTRINKWINVQSLWHVIEFLAAQTMMSGKGNLSEILAGPWGNVWGQILLRLTPFSLCWRIWWNLATCSQFYTWAVGYFSPKSEIQVHGTVTTKLCNPCSFSFCSWGKKGISHTGNQEIQLGRGFCQEHVLAQLQIIFLRSLSYDPSNTEWFPPVLVTPVPTVPLGCDIFTGLTFSQWSKK